MLETITSLDRQALRHRYDVNDRFTLVDGVVPDDRGLHDGTTGERLVLDPLGVALIARLAASEPPTLGELAAALVARYDLDPQAAFSRVTDYLDALDRSAVLRRLEGPSPVEAARTTVRTRGLGLFVVDWLSVARGGRTDRHPPTVRGLTAAVVRTQWIIPALGVVLALAVLAITALALGVDRVSDSGQVRAVILSPLLVGLAHVVLFWVHEGGHLLVAAHGRGGRTEPRFVVTRGRKVGIVRTRGRAADEVLISAAGPIAAASMAFAFGLLGFQGTGEGSSTDSYLLSSIALVLGIGHLLSLLPFAADGHNIVVALRRGDEGRS